MSIPVRIGFDTTSGTVSVALEDFHVNTGTSNARYVFQINTDQLGPGDRRVYPLGPISVVSYLDELHRLEVRVDDAKVVAEANETDNVWFTEYVLARYGVDDKDCAEPEEIAAMEQGEFDMLLRREAAWQKWVEYWMDTGTAYSLDGDNVWTRVRDALGRKLERLCKDSEPVCEYTRMGDDPDTILITFTVRRSGV